jgi:hypothetical protein
MLWDLFRILTGRVCCLRHDGKPEWSPWVRKEADFQRMVDWNERVTTGVQTVSCIKIWQERQCSTCGKIQQQDLKY